MSTQPAQRAAFIDENSAYNKAWFREVQSQVSSGAPFAVVNVDTPTEIFKAMGIPTVINQWWASICSAKQKGPSYLGELTARGWREGLCSYCSMSFGSVLSDDTDKPWGGLPKPTILVTNNDCGSKRKVFEEWGAREGIPVFILEHPVIDEPERAEIASMRHDWDRIIGARQIDYLAAQYRELIALLEKLTGRTFDMSKFEEVMRLVNEQEEHYAATRDLIAETSPAPMNVIEQMPATMVPQWHRGTSWGVSRAKAFNEEVMRRVETSVAACPTERHRLMWLGRGLWHNLPFYRQFERDHGAVFVWSVYLAIASDGYPRYGGDPLRALASRMLGIFAIVQEPPFVTDWYVQEARRAGINGVVRMGDERGGCKPLFGRRRLVDDELRAAGFPVLTISADAVDPRQWDQERIAAQISDFIETKLTPVA